MTFHPRDGGKRMEEEEKGEEECAGWSSNGVSVLHISASTPQSESQGPVQLP